MGKFQIKVTNEKELYEHLLVNQNIEFEEKNCESLEWTLIANISSLSTNGFEINTIIKKKKKEYLPKKALTDILGNYEFESKSGVIVIDEDKYLCSIINDNKKYIIYLEYYENSFEGLKKVLKKNNEMLENLVKAYCKKNKLEVPDFEYLLNTSKMNEDNINLIEKDIEINEFEITFEDIGGNYEGKKEMNRIYQDIINPKVAMLFGRDPNKSKGYLLYGKKGNGKTMLVKALATKLHNELKDKIKFYSINYLNIASTLRGGEAGKLKEYFKLIESNEKKGLTTIVFMDELQSIGIRNSVNSNEALDSILTLIGGIKSYKKAVFIGASYCPKNQLDSALIRPGRLGNHVEIKTPTMNERKEIIEIYLKKEIEFVKKKAGFEKLFDTINIDLISKKTEGYNGSDIMMLFESVRHNKEEETLNKITSLKIIAEIKTKIIPITTNDFLKVIKKGLNKKESTIYS
jgi:SpoVK/Ycf46/Vps4 family AAA+-type ATPase